MTTFKGKVIASAEHMKNVVTETAGKGGHAAAEALDKTDHALADVAPKAMDLAVEAAGKIKHRGEKSTDKAQVKDAGDRKTNAGN